MYGRANLDLLRTGCTAMCAAIVSETALNAEGGDIQNRNADSNLQPLPPHSRIGQQFGGRALEHHAAMAHYIDAARDA